MTEFQAKVQKYINAKEVALARHDIQGKKRKFEKISPTDRKYQRDRRERSPEKSYPEKYCNYTHINQSPEKGTDGDQT